MVSISQLTPRVGARVDARKTDLTSSDFAAEVLNALERYGVLLFPQIHLTDEEQVNFGNMLGNVVAQGETHADGSQDTFFKITLDPKENSSSAEYLKASMHWHIDGIFEDMAPPKATMLSALRLSAWGGQTEFCNTYAAYQDLSDAERKRIDTLQVMHSMTAANRHTSPDASAEERERWQQRRAPKEHPLVWNHLTGRKSLVLGLTTDYIVGMPREQSSALLDKLTAHTTRPENVYRHEWQVGDLLMWDNTGLLHRVVPYAADSGRMMHRTILRGTESINGQHRHDDAA